jgi:hypothetical protein
MRGPIRDEPCFPTVVEAFVSADRTRALANALLHAWALQEEFA